MTRISMSMRQLREFCQVDSRLAEILEDLADVWPIETLYVTSIARTPEEDGALNASGIHACGPPHRALDVRIRTLPDNYQETAEYLAESLNKCWMYDYNRPDKVVCYAKVHGSGPHMHLQVHANTVRNRG